MESSVLNLLETLLNERSLSSSWNQDMRRDLGIPEEYAHEQLLCLGLERNGVRLAPLTFLLDQKHLKNVMTALSEFLRESFTRPDAIAVVDYMSPMDELGAARGVSRRWVLDASQHALILPEIESYLRVIIY